MRIFLRLVLFAVLSGTAHASSIVFENPWNCAATDAGTFSNVDEDLGPYYVELAGQFRLGTAAIVNRATWHGTLWQQADPLNTGDAWSFDVRFFADSGGLPGTPLATHAVSAAVTDTGVNIQGERAYQFNASFPNLPLAAETPYWFSVVTTEDPMTFRWNPATSGMSSAVGSVGAWQTYEEVLRTPLNFTLHVPEPSAAAIILVGGLSAIAGCRSANFGHRDLSSAVLNQVRGCDRGQEI